MPTAIKTELDLVKRHHYGLYGMPHVTGTSSSRTSRNKTGHEVIEILSDSEDSDSDKPFPKENSSLAIDSIMRIASVGEILKEDTIEIPTGKKCGLGKKFSLPFDPSMFTKESGTTWTDSKVTSFTVEGEFQVTKEVQVDRSEYLASIPCVWPIPKIPTVFILDLRDDEKYLVRKKAGGNSATPVTPDFLLKNMVRVILCYLI